MDVPLRLLIVEDSVEDTFLIVRRLQQGGFTVTFERVETATGLRDTLRAQAWDLVISDFSMPGFTGDAALAVFQQAGLDIPFIVVSGAIGEEVAVQLLKAGAHEFVKKDNLVRLVPAVRQELAAAAERRKRLQAQALSEYLASIVESCEDAIIGKTVDGTIVSWNSGAEHLYGYTALEMIGQSVSRLIPPYRPDELPEVVEKLKRGESVEDLETVRIRKDGVPIEVSITISPVRGPDGVIMGASSVARDISRRKKEENERLMLIRDLTTALSGNQS
jgi:two-component system, cell cycle sensor histidine kinase and response regulator CckA